MSVTLGISQNMRKGVIPMAKIIKEITDIAVRNEKAGSKPKHIFDGKGLFLLIPPQKFFPDGKPQPPSKWWRFKYQFNGKTKMLSFGIYPDVSLADARDKRDAARKQIAAGIDPGEVRKMAKVAQSLTFEAVAREWHGKQMGVWSTRHTEDVIRDTMSRDYMCLIILHIPEFKHLKYPLQRPRRRAGYALCTWCEAR
jgi:hypothetical protein